MGQTVWGGRAADSAAGVSWDWIEVAEGVVAISDPMMMITNLRVLGRDGEVLTAHEAAPHLNAIVNRLPWQAEVQRALADAELEARRRSAPEELAGRRSGRRDLPSTSGFTPLS